MSRRGRKPHKDVSQISCPNQTCSHFGIKGLSSIVCNGIYTVKGGTGQRFRCNACGQSFCRRTGTLFEGLRSNEWEVIAALKLLAKGIPIRKASQVLGLKEDTLRMWLIRMAAQSEAVNQQLINELGATEAELTALWDFVKHGKLRQRAIDWRKRCGWRQGWDT